MFKKSLTPIFFVPIIFLLSTSYIYASFEITEIMYDLDGTDTSREWIEVKNIGSSPEDLSQWFFFSDNSKHALTPQGVSMVEASAFAIIVQDVNKFRTDWPNYSGTIFDSSWTGLNNSGETIALKDPSLNIISQVTFTSSQGGGGDGNSLQNTNGSWTGALPTPGKENQSYGGGSDPSPSGTNNTTIPQQQIVKKKEIETPRITTDIIANTTVFSGIPFTITANTFGLSKEPLTMGKFVWNFGDGSTKEESEHHLFKHTYMYPGDYVVTLSYYRVFNNTILDASDRLTIKVIPSEIVISSIGDSVEPYVELENKSTLEINISNWVIKSSGRSFFIPMDTIILPKQKIRFPSYVTMFSIYDLAFVELQNPPGMIISTLRRSLGSNNNKVNNSSYSLPNTDKKENNIINLNDLSASAIKSNNNIPRTFTAIIGLITVVMFGIISITLIGKKKNNTNELEDGLGPEDIKLIE